MISFHEVLYVHIQNQNFLAKLSGWEVIEFLVFIFISQSNCVHFVADTVNTTEARIKDILQRAQSVSPSVLLLRNINVLTKEEPMNVESKL